jgi:hypothetical protein
MHTINLPMKQDNTLLQIYAAPGTERNMHSSTLAKWCIVQGRSFSASNPFNNLFVNVFSVNNSEYPYFISLNFVDHPVIADS